MFIEFKAREKHASPTADQSEYHESFQDCGYLLKNDEIVIDIDGLPKKTIEKLITTFDIKTQIVWTSRGCHLYYKLPKGYRNKADFFCPLGFKVESFTVKQRPNGVTIKRDGTIRQIDNMGVREELPDFFKGNTGSEDMNGLDEGDGRNQKLHSHKFKIMSLKDHKKILRFINENIFAAPMEEDEFLTVIRDEKINAGENQEPQVADGLKRKLKVVKYNDRLYSYNGTRYVSEEIEQEIYEELPDKKTYYVEEVIRQLTKRTRNTPQPLEGWDIKFKNGILRNGKFYHLDSSEFTPYYVNVEYNEDAEVVSAVDEYLTHLSGGDHGYIKLILQMMAHGLITNPEVKRQIAKFFVLIGDGGNGKGTLLTIIRMLFGDENCASNSIEEIADERYFVGLQGKLFNLGDDIQDQPIDHEQMKRLKNVATCDYVATRMLFKQSKDAVLTTSMIFTSNHALKTFEKGESYQRRVVWMPMFSKVTKKDPRFISKLTTQEAKEYWVKLIVEMYQELYATAEITIPDVVADHNKEYHADNNNVLEFIEGYTNDHFVGMRPPEIYDMYEIWVNENGLTLHSKKMLKETLEKVRGLEVATVRVHGKVAKAYQLKQGATAL
ncbi:phage/plasmid primase, P4 family [Paenibacillus solisilvae]|uniref:Phage/plasmid primase, P4 family n=1 Tax=Paenibacillus solisilvae TaxID=2486751 RepID=A0ABW0VXT9_9BACL